MHFLDNLAVSWQWLKSYPEERRRWCYRLQDRQLTARVYYGYKNIPTTGSHVFGGLVKLQDLQTIFPNSPDTPNILYLVSSSLPVCAVRMAEMAKRAGVKIVVNQNGVAYPGWYGRGWEQCNRPMKALHQLADYVVYQSRFCKVSSDRFLGQLCKNWEVLFNPVDTAVFSPIEERSYGRRGIRLLLAGSHGDFYRPRTAVDVLHRVAQRVNDVELCIAGRFCWRSEQSEAEREIAEYAEKVGVIAKVRFLGPYTQQEAVELLRNADILLHTKYNDPCPRLVVEAMACGLPVVYSATGGVPELVGDDAGYGVAGSLDWERDHPPDAQKLAEGVLHILGRLPEYGAAARKRAVNSFDVQPWLARHREIFASIL